MKEQLEASYPSLEQQRKALKEWAVVVQALGNGEQILLLRKGGIAEKTPDFVMENRSFYFFPTYEHEKIKDVKLTYQPLFEAIHQNQPSTLRITHWAEVMEDIPVKDPGKIRKLSPYHIWTEPFIEMRLQYKPESPLHVLLLKVYRLETPKDLPMQSVYTGCKSWVTLDENIPVSSSQPVLQESTLHEKIHQIKKTLGVSL